MKVEKGQHDGFSNEQWASERSVQCCIVVVLNQNSRKILIHSASHDLQCICLLSSCSRPFQYQCMHQIESNLRETKISKYPFKSRFKNTSPHHASVIGSPIAEHNFCLHINHFVKETSDYCLLDIISTVRSDFHKHLIGTMYYITSTSNLLSHDQSLDTLHNSTVVHIKNFSK